MFRWLLLLVVVSIPVDGIAAEDFSAPSALNPVNFISPGHSMLGEAFDEGPRRAATLLGTTGRVTFPITTSSPLVQQFFNQGFGQLHGFWYFEAERSFRQAAKLDPECAMNYFGMALANTNNDSRAKGFIAEAVKRMDRVSEREKLYIKAIDDWYKSVDTEKNKEKAKKRATEYVKSLEEIIYRYPEDLEAKAMLCLALWQRRSDLGLSSYFAIDALINDVLTANPYHPVHHFRIHLWDNDKAKIAINSAERCGLSAPGIAHMWHMSGHTYSELEQYFDAVWHQEASARTDHAYMMRDGIFPDRIHNFAHNNEWLVKNLQYVGRVHDAVTLAKNAIELPRHPKLNPFPGEKSAHFGRLRLLQIYNQFEMWDQLIADSQSQILCPTNDDIEQIKYFRNLGRAYFRQQDPIQGRVQLAKLEQRLKRHKQDTDNAVDVAVARARFDGLDAKAIDRKRNEAVQSNAEKTKALERAVDEMRGHLLLTEGKASEALVLFLKADDIDEIFLAEVEFLAGKGDEALKRLRGRIGRNKNQVRPMAALIELLWRQEKKDEARQAFETLRDISGSIDLDARPFARLQPITTELGFGNDWRKPKPVARNAAELPDLSTLGPFVWQPTTASEWSLPDGDGKMHSLTDYRGKPVVVLFYLGAGCLHCVEQLQVFASKHKTYAEAGIQLIAITTETTQLLKKSQDRYNVDGGFPFLIVADTTLELFKKVQAFDDFEGVPLHATCLIDGDGRMRWQDIGAEPFMDADFLLDEARRLLFPGRMELPVEPELLKDSGPADALSPRNQFSPTKPPAAKTSEKSEIARGE